MATKLRLVTLILFWCLPCVCFASLIDKIEKKCEASSIDKNQIDCIYKVGHNLEIEVVGIGDSQASIVFNKVNDKDYVVKYQTSPKCMLVGSRKYPDNIFISPRSGKLFSDVTACQLN